jgi:UPF0755 protein
MRKNEDGYGRRGRRGAKIFVIVLVVLVAIVAAAYIFYQSGLKPVDPDSKQTITVVIYEGSGSSGISDTLKDADLIRNKTIFRLHTKFTNQAEKLRAGTFELSKSMSADEILEVLISGKNLAEQDVVNFTIPEGYNITQIKNVLVEKGLVTEEEFLNEIANGVFDYRFVEGLPAGNERLEGFLYPDTYEVFADASAHDIIDKMLSRFDELFTDEYYAKAEASNISVYDAVVMASIIERESKKAEERPVMARVFYNRLNIDMPLQSCATIQYILGEPKEFLTDEDTQIESPYNTYLHNGMPPGPICNPRIESIEAALYPDSNDYIYFVLSEKLDGSHNFSADYDKFEQDKAAYYNAVEQ